MTVGTYINCCYIDCEDTIEVRVDEAQDLEINLYNRKKGEDIEVFLEKDEAIELAEYILNKLK